ncbi:carboxypeptidase, partial [Lactobacillus curvatus]|nr:carboxypeptidase [Latilactobacillus curvatus]
KLYTAHFITKIVDAQGKVIVDNTENDSKKIMTKKIANEMTSMMMDVYRTGGTGQSASPSGYTIAGKTGSTESLTASNSSNENDHWYIG